MNPYEENADYNGTPAQRLDAQRNDAFKEGQKESSVTEVSGQPTQPDN